MKWFNLLAQQDDGTWVINVVIVLLIFVGMGIKVLLEWLKEAKAKDRERQEPAAPPMHQRPAEPAEQGPRSVEEIVRTMRQARRPDQREPQRPQPRPQPAPQVRPPRPAPRPEMPHVTPPAVAEGVEAEAKRLQEHLFRQQQTAQRVAGGPTGVLAITGGGPAAHMGRSVVQIGLGDLDEARRGILYSEILGPPIALRKGQAMWDV